MCSGLPRGMQVASSMASGDLFAHINGRRPSVLSSIMPICGHNTLILVFVGSGIQLVYKYIAHIMHRSHPRSLLDHS